MAASPVAHHGNVVVLGGPTRLVEEHGSRAGSTAHVDEGGNDFAGVSLEELRVSVLPGLDLVDEAHVPTTAVIGVAASVEVHERIDRDVVYIA